MGRGRALFRVVDLMDLANLVARLTQGKTPRGRGDV